MKRTFLTASLSLLLLAGCGEKVKPTLEGRADPYQSRQIMFADERLRTITAVGAPVLTRSRETDLLYVEVPIRAATNKTLYIEYQMIFLDENGQTIQETTWFNRTLQSNVPQRLRANATSPRATDFIMNIRYARMDQ
jgi:uncharacterized protein YcfL